EIHPGAFSTRDWLARWSVHCAANPKIVPPVQGFLKEPRFRPVLREIMGDIEKPCTFDVSWRSSTVMAIAQTIYDCKDFAALPILAEALEEAGCSDIGVVNHCRAAENHFRGCWAVDLVLTKE